MKNTKKKTFVIAILCIALVLMGTGYAILSTSLNISGTNTVSGKWDIHIESINATSVGGTAVAKNVIIGDDKLEKIIIKNGKKENEIIVDGMFISIGLMPQSDFLKGIIDLDKFNYAVSFDTKTKIDGIFVAGDIRTKPFRQITTAVNDGTTSALYALEYLDN